MTVLRGPEPTSSGECRLTRAPERGLEWAHGLPELGPRPVRRRVPGRPAPVSTAGAARGGAGRRRLARALYGVFAMARYAGGSAPRTRRLAHALLEPRGRAQRLCAQKSPGAGRAWCFRSRPAAAHPHARSVLWRAMSGPALEALRPGPRRDGRNASSRERSGARAHRREPRARRGLRAERLPLARAVGLAEEGRGNLHRRTAAWRSTRSARATACSKKSFANAQKVAEWIGAQRACAPRCVPSGLGARVYAEADAGEISEEEEAALLVRSMLSAGLDTTIAGINAAATPLRDEPHPVAAAAGGAVALCSGAFGRGHAPRLARADLSFRTTTREVEVAGNSSSPKARRRCCSSPPRTGISRRVARPRPLRHPGGAAPANPAFGHGVHMPSAVVLARMETELVLAALAKRGRGDRARGRANLAPQQHPARDRAACRSRSSRASRAAPPRAGRGARPARG